MNATILKKLEGFNIIRGADEPESEFRKRAFLSLFPSEDTFRKGAQGGRNPEELFVGKPREWNTFLGILTKLFPEMGRAAELAFETLFSAETREWNRIDRMFANLAFLNLTNNGVRSGFPTGEKLVKFAANFGEIDFQKAREDARNPAPKSYKDAVEQVSTAILAGLLKKGVDGATLQRTLGGMGKSPPKKSYEEVISKLSQKIRKST
jgi:hypothetical protein